MTGGSRPQRTLSIRVGQHEAWTNRCCYRCSTCHFHEFTSSDVSSRLPAPTQADPTRSCTLHAEPAALLPPPPNLVCKDHVTLCHYVYRHNQFNVVKLYETGSSIEHAFDDMLSCCFLNDDRPDHTLGSSHIKVPVTCDDRVHKRDIS